MRLLFIGDIFARPGRRAVKELLPKIKQSRSIDFTVANGENAAGGFGLTEDIARELFECGIDVLTTGNHIWNNDVGDYLKRTNLVLRPLNYPPGSPGFGFCTIKKDPIKISVINVCGRVFMGAFDCPFRKTEEVLDEIKGTSNIVIVDIHAEATSEKRAFGHYFDGRISLVAGTHTHIQTADEEVLKRGTAYITDVGMTGAHDSVIGVKKEIIIDKFLYQRSKRFEPAREGIRINAVIVDVDENTGKARSIERINEKFDQA